MQHDWDILYSFGSKKKKRKEKGYTWDRVMGSWNLMLLASNEPTVSENIVAMAIGKHWSVYVTLSFVQTPAL